MNEQKENMQNAVPITNEMLYQLILNVKAEMATKSELKAEILELKVDMNRRFDDVDRKFEDVYRSFTEIRELIKEEKREREKMSEKLDEVYKERDKVTVRFTRAWMFGSFFIAMLASTVVLAFDRAF